MAFMDIQQILLTSSTLGAGVLSGLYFIFSFCVMGALNAQPPASAIATMNTINTMIVNPPFMLFFMGTPIVCAVLLSTAVKEGIDSSLDSTLTAAGALTLLLGEFLLTVMVHVPKNNALAAHVVGSSTDAVVWARYYTPWTAWNHVRMLASMITVVLLSRASNLRASRLAFTKPTQMEMQ